jgi:hypothetical protein
MRTVTTPENYLNRIKALKANLVGRVLAGIKANLLKEFSKCHGSRREKRLQLIERLQLGGKGQLVLITCDGQPYLLGFGGDGVQTIVGIEGRAATDIACCTDVGVASGCGE